MTIADTAKLLACITLPAACALASSAATAKETVTELQPTSQWNVDWADTYCKLQRSFGTADEPFLFRMSSYAPGYNFEIYLSGKSLQPFVNRMRLSYAFGQQQPSKIERPTGANSDKFGPGIIFSDVIRPENASDDDQAANGQMPYPDLALERSLDGFSLSTGHRKLILATGPMKAALAALRKCTNDLVAQWGLDPKVQANLTRHTGPADIMALVTVIQRTYPMSAVNVGQQARINLHTLVDAKGHVTDCTISESYSDPEFDALACKHVRETRFEPALDANGVPVASFWNSTISYRMRE